ncbi:hypothetical protein U3C44_23445 (plasmid) [Enterobacter asburiae]|uniref:hypothetical protein n=1 Tax=Enterobacter asburiae TaxID=61645 RepID=UPI0029338BF4|nr:hypothetical protein [Enterobacter asburiae]EMA4739432.1 hypothetical protein [Enterobacter asburiae]
MSRCARCSLSVQHERRTTVSVVGIARRYIAKTAFSQRFAEASEWLNFILLFQQHLALTLTLPCRHGEEGSTLAPAVDE